MESISDYWTINEDLERHLFKATLNSTTKPTIILTNPDLQSLREILSGYMGAELSHPIQGVKALEIWS